jgi:hypothetical protein
MTRRSLVALSLAVLGLSLVAAAAAQAAASTTSSNWAGYAVTAKKTSTKFKSVSGTWVVPTGTCTQGQSGYSATWLGLGGYSKNSQALEQTGTEFDCSSSGQPKYSAWYELVPAPGKDIKMTVKPGDTIDAAVTVQSRKVTIMLRDRTTGKTYQHTSTMSAPDVSTAEWIVEAPSACDSTGQRCAQLPVSNFGTELFSHARATTTTGHRGTITDSAWTPTQIQLSQGGTRRPGFADASSTAGATPSALAGSGSSFTVSYSQTAPGTGQTTPRTFTPAAGGGPWNGVFAAR